MEKFNLILLVKYSDALIVKENISYIQKNILPENIYVITKNSIINLLKKIVSEENVIFLDEDNIIPDLNFNILKQKLSMVGYSPLTGWYFQQFIKMYFAKTIYANDYYLIWDADTLPIRQITFFDNDNILFAPKFEYHLPYFQCIKKLLNLDKEVSFSFIAEHMMIKTKMMIRLIDDIAVNNKKRMWFDNIIDNISENSPNGFSEFETYGTYCMHEAPSLYKPRYLYTFRHAGLFFGRCIKRNEIKKLSLDFDTISLENRDLPPFPRNIYQYSIYLLLRAFYK